MLKWSTKIFTSTSKVTKKDNLNKIYHNLIQSLHKLNERSHVKNLFYSIIPEFFYSNEAEQEKEDYRTLQKRNYLIAWERKVQFSTDTNNTFSKTFEREKQQKDWHSERSRQQRLLVINQSASDKKYNRLRSAIKLRDVVAALNMISAKFKNSLTEKYDWFETAEWKKYSPDEWKRSEEKTKYFC